MQLAQEFANDNYIAKIMLSGMKSRWPVRPLLQEAQMLMQIYCYR